MRRLRPSHLVIGALTLAAASKITEFGFEDPQTGALPPEIAAFLAWCPRPQAAGSPEGDEKGKDKEAMEAQSCEPPEAIFAEITRERGLLADQTEALFQREAEIALSKEKLDIEAQQLREYKESLEALLQRVQAAQNEDLDAAREPLQEHEAETGRRHHRRTGYRGVRSRLRRHGRTRRGPDPRQHRPDARTAPSPRSYSNARNFRAIRTFQASV